MDPQAETNSTELFFHHYRVLHREDGSLWKLGSGGMGTTYKAIDDNLDAVVALKVISADLLNVDPFARDRFIREAKSAASLRHRHVATVYHLGKDGQNSISMRWSSSMGKPWRSASSASVRSPRPPHSRSRFRRPAR